MGGMQDQNVKNAKSISDYNLFRPVTGYITISGHSQTSHKICKTKAELQFTFQSYWM